MIVLSLFDYTGNMVRPWADAGYRCIIVDIQHGPVSSIAHPNIETVGGDIRHYLPPRGEYAAVFAFPPCTHLAVSGARWFKGKGLRKLAESIELFAKAAEICEWTGAPYLLENPVSTISSYWRKPDYSFDPCDYADYEGGEDDRYTKKTCLWTGGGFRMPVPHRLDPTQGSKMHLLPPSSERANLRSATPMGFARAVFEANAKMARQEAA
ncbi:MAG TPA: hypothetical protein VIT62_14470 [Lysobacter sp.]